MSGNKDVCKLCERTLAKSAGALKCLHCEVWLHVGCWDLVDEDCFYEK